MKYTYIYYIYIRYIYIYALKTIYRNEFNNLVQHSFTNCHNLILQYILNRNATNAKVTNVALGMQFTAQFRILTPEISESNNGERTRDPQSRPWMRRGFWDLHNLLLLLISFTNLFVLSDSRCLSGKRLDSALDGAVVAFSLRTYKLLSSPPGAAFFGVLPMALQ